MSIQCLAMNSYLTVLVTRKSPTKTLVRLANGQRVTSSNVCKVTFELARHEIQRTFHVLRDLRVADLVMV
jgi:hypothetical protein